MRNGDAPGKGGVLVLSMAATGGNQVPAVGFDQFDEFLAAHGGGVVGVCNDTHMVMQRATGCRIGGGFVMAPPTGGVRTFGWIMGLAFLPAGSVAAEYGTCFAQHARWSHNQGIPDSGRPCLGPSLKLPSPDVGRLSGIAMSQATNQQEFDRASQVLVGGVNSAVRAFRAVGGTPRFIQRAEGARMWDVEGKAYIDYVGSWGPAIVGHSHPEVLKAVQAAVADGLSFGAPNVRETELAQKMCDMFPHVERVRFTSSGTESTMSALRLARGYTGRNRIIKFEGCYHGTADSLLVKAGSGALAFGNPSSAGVPEDVVKHTLIARYNDLDSVRRLFEQYPDDVACLIVEPIPGNMNLMVPQPGFLEGLRELCTQYGAVLIFDEVMSGFRVTLTGAQGWCGITPDLSTFGKVIGGGMPVGAVAGPARIMERFAPLGNVYQAGTLSGNPIAMAAGIATIDLISRPGFHDELNRRMTRLVDGLNAAAKKTGVAFCARALGGLGGMYFRATPPVYFEEATDQNLEQYKRFYHLMLEGGVYLPPSPVEAFFLSSAHTDEDIDQTVALAEKSLAAVA